MQHQHHVRILLARVAQIGQHRAFLGAMFDATVELMRHNEWQIQLALHLFQLAADRVHGLRTILVRFRRAHQPEAVDEYRADVKTA